MAAQPTLKLEQFRPGFSDDELAGLQQSLKAARLPAETYASRQKKYGITHAWMKQAIERWQNEFDWCIVFRAFAQRWADLSVRLIQEEARGFHQ